MSIEFSNGLVGKNQVADMKRCPECRRDYYDETLLYCLDDGSALVDGPHSYDDVTRTFPKGSSPNDSDDQTAVTMLLPSKRFGLSSRKFWILSCIATVVIGALAYIYVAKENEIRRAELIPPPTPPVVKLYWEMSNEEKLSFVGERAKFVQGLIGDDQDELDVAAVQAIKEQIDDFVEDKDSLSQKPFEEGLRVIYGRATQFAPTVIRAFDEQKVPPALGLYQAMIESEYHDCPEIDWDHPGRAPVGLFQFSRRTATLYGMKPTDYCDVRKQCDAAARHMSDLISDFGTERSSWTLALISFNQGAEEIRDYLRQLRGRGITERSYWAIFRHQAEVSKPMNEEANRYVPRFFAAAIIGETPASFDLSTPPLTDLRNR